MIQAAKSDSIPLRRHGIVVGRVVVTGLLELLGNFFRAQSGATKPASAMLARPSRRMSCWRSVWSTAIGEARRSSP
jgi:hypothetical protein